MKRMNSSRVTNYNCTHIIDNLKPSGRIINNVYVPKFTEGKYIKLFIPNYHLL